jgi:hypothetical protein
MRCESAACPAQPLVSPSRPAIVTIARSTPRRLRLATPYSAAKAFHKRSRTHVNLSRRVRTAAACGVNSSPRHDARTRVWDDTAGAHRPCSSSCDPSAASARRTPSPRVAFLAVRRRILDHRRSPLPVDGAAPTRPKGSAAKEQSDQDLIPWTSTQAASPDGPLLSLVTPAQWRCAPAPPTWQQWTQTAAQRLMAGAASRVASDAW